VLTGTANQVVITDGGAGGTVTLSAPQNLHTGANFQVSSLGVGTTASGVAGDITATRGLRVGFTGAPAAADRVEIGDANLYLGLSTNVTLAFDGLADAIVYTRASNLMYFVVGGATRVEIQTGGLAIGTSIDFAGGVRVFYIQNRSTAPTSGPAAGLVTYAESGELKARGATGNPYNLTQGSARAWVYFDGTGTVAILDQYNVASITDNGTGDYTVNFTTAVASVNFAAVFGVTDDNNTTPGIHEQGINEGNRTTTAVRVNTVNNVDSAVDRSGVSVAILGDP
jgi:hypothetical protein